MPTFTLSPKLAPTYSCGSSVSVLSIDTDDGVLLSTLNPDAPTFVPKCYDMDKREAAIVDDIMHQMHHGLSVYDSEQLQMAQEFAEADVPDDDVAEFLDREEAMYSDLHAPAQKAKGSTYGRKRDARKSR